MLKGQGPTGENVSSSPSSSSACGSKVMMTVPAGLFSRTDPDMEARVGLSFRSWTVTATVEVVDSAGLPESVAWMVTLCASESSKFNSSSVRSRLVPGSIEKRLLSAPIMASVVVCPASWSRACRGRPNVVPTGLFSATKPGCA